MMKQFNKIFYIRINKVQKFNLGYRSVCNIFIGNYFPHDSILLVNLSIRDLLKIFHSLRE